MDRKLLTILETQLLDMNTIVSLWLASLLLNLRPVLAEKDSNYYGSGHSNPVTHEKMYWRDAPNVLQDLSEFDKLYVTFHNCAWSPYGEDQENPCNVASANDDSYWYLGKTECYRANAAYSLYGILHGEEDKGCTKRTFINSFFTNEGIEGFTTALEQTGYFSFSVSENGNQNNGNQNNKGNNYPAGMSSQCYNGGNNDGNNNGRSYGLACSGKNFVSKKFKGSYCDVNHEVGVTDNNEEFNMQLANAECIPIFSSSTYDGNEDSSLKLLQYSRACSVNQFPEQCPDPYGKLKAYQRTMNHASEKANDPRREKLRNGFSWILLAVGILLLLAAFSLYLEQKREQSRHRRTSKSQERGRSAKIENTSDKKDTRRQRNVQSRSRSQESQRGGWWRRVRRSFGRK